MGWLNFFFYNIFSILVGAVDWMSGGMWELIVYSLSGNTLYTLVFLITACLALVKSPDGYEKMRALKEDGRPSDDSWLIFCIFDKRPLILFSWSVVLLCCGSVVCCSLI